MCETSWGWNPPFISILAAPVANENWPRDRPLTEVGGMRERVLSIKLRVNFFFLTLDLERERDE
jgi:hypothetical protein